MQRHQALDLALIGAASFRELIAAIFETLKQSSELDVVTLALLDGEYDIRRILADLQIKLSEFPHLLFLEDPLELGELGRRLHKPVLGTYDEQLHGIMFPDPIPVPASAAIVPLVRNKQLIGCLNFGSFDGKRFAASMATDFIEHLSSILAICIENVINHERLKHIGLTDPLTGVNNRRYVERRLQEEVGRVQRQSHPLSCLYIDIDHFKKINDTHGHHAGDEVLREVAGRLQAELRLSDALGRFGGEEFLLLLIDAEMADAVMVAERIRASVAETPIRVGRTESLTLTVSIGVATLNHPVPEGQASAIAQQLVATADRNLYHAKETGRNKVVGGY
jgi:diguanylate cyclase (GGDEF)-like protein